MPAERRASNACVARLGAGAHAHDEQVVAVQVAPRRGGRQRDLLVAVEQLAVPAGHARCAPPPSRRAASSWLSAERALEVGDPVVEAERLHLVVPAALGAAPAPRPP